MKNKNVIKRVLFEGQHQISAVLPRQLSPIDSINTFVYKIPMLLNKSYFTNNQIQKKVDNFKVIFYKKENFNSDFNSKFYNDTLDFKKFDSTTENSSSIFFSENLKNITKSFYQDGVTNDIHYDINFRESDIINQEFYIYNITLSNSISRQIKDEGYSCIRIFAIKNNNIIDDTDFILFENNRFLRTVYDTKKIYDLQYFIDKVYFKNFSNTLNLSLPNDLGVSNQSIILNKSTQFDSNIVEGDADVSISFQNNRPETVVNFNFNSNTLSPRISKDISNSSFFDDIVKHYLSGLEIFTFQITCRFSLRDQETRGDLQFDHPFEKQLSFSRSDSFITRIVDAFKDNYLEKLYDRCDFNLKVIADNSRQIEVVLKAENDITERSQLSYFKVKSIKKNEKSFNDGELFSSKNLSINDKISFLDIDLHELTFTEDKTFRFFIPNNTSSIFSKIKVNIVSNIDSGFNEKCLESDVFIINPDYENIFNKLNKRLNEAINIDSNGLSRNISGSGFFTSYNRIRINNVRRRFGDIAYSLGYFDQQNTQNTQSTSDILDFFKSCIFSFEINESLQNIRNASFKKQRYFFGNQIINSDLLENDSIEINQNFISSYLSISVEAILKNAILNNNASLNTINVINSFSGLDEISRIPVEVIEFLRENNFFINKVIKIKVIPIPKLIKIYQTQVDLDDNLNIIFPEGVSENIKNSINLDFVDLFYDKNSSFNWNKFLEFKKLYFKDYKNPDQALDVASYLSPIWDYLSSSIYIKESNIFSKRENFNSRDFENVLLNRNLQDSQSGSQYSTPKFLERALQLKNIFVKTHFQNSNNKYYDFRINNKEILSIENTGMQIRFDNFEYLLTDSELKSPKTINFTNTNLNKEKRIDLNISGLRSYFNDQDISRMNFLVKVSIHPLIVNTFNSIINDVDLTNFINTPLGVSQQFYFTQNHNYMINNPDYFFEYNNPLNKLNSRIYEKNDELKMSLYLGDNRRKFSLITFKDLFDYCISNNANVLKGFYLRVGFSFEINNNFYYANIYKEIDEANLNNSSVIIDRIERIIET